MTLNDRYDPSPTPAESESRDLIQRFRRIFTSLCLVLNVSATTTLDAIFDGEAISKSQRQG
jgi:hypothetical protein